MSPEIAAALALWRAYDLAVVESKRADDLTVPGDHHPTRKRSRALIAKLHRVTPAVVKAVEDEGDDNSTGEPSDEYNTPTLSDSHAVRRLT